MQSDVSTRQAAAVDGVLAAIDLKREGSGLPLYQQLANAFVIAIEDGTLGEGERLPPHRDLASLLNINITTVTRAIAQLKALGLVESRPGRGTVVGSTTQPADVQFQSAPITTTRGVDLSVNRPATDKYLEVLEQLLPSLHQDARFSAVKDYQPSEGPDWARLATANWLHTQGLEVSSDQLVLVEGAQHGLAAVLRAITHPGDVLLANPVSYQGINALCHTLGLDLHAVAGDQYGMSPTALDRACRELQPRALFLNPCLHNPTTVTLTEERRRELMQVATLHGIKVIEDDVYRPLLEDKPTPLINLAPDLVFHVTALSKCAAPGMRFGVVAAPRAFVGDVATAVRVDCWSVSPLTALIATRMIETGGLDKLVRAQTDELRVRNAILRDVLSGHHLGWAPVSTHAWLHLPPPWRGSDFARICHNNGIEILPGEAFTLRHEAPPHAVRINLAAARSREELERGLKTLSDLVSSGHQHVHSRV